MMKLFLISFVALFSLMAMPPAHAATRQELQVELNGIDDRIAEIENRIAQLESQLQQGQGKKDKPERDETSPDDEDDEGIETSHEMGYPDDLDDLMVSLQDDDKYTGRKTSTSQKKKNLVKAFSGAKKTDQQDEKGKFVSLSKDTETKEGIDLDKLAKSIETERIKSDQEKTDTQKADQAAYDEAIKRDMQIDAETWKEQMAQSQEMMKRKRDEAKQLIADAREQGKDFVTDKEFQDKMDKIKSDYNIEKTKLDDIIRRKKKAQKAKEQAAANQQGDGSTDGSDTASEVARILSSAPEDLDQRTIECSTTSKSGGDKPAVVTVNMKESFGTAVFRYEMYDVKDRMIVQYGGQSLLDTGCISGSSKVSLQLSGESDQITVIVQPACEKKGTSWNFSLACPESQPQSDK